MIAGATAYGLRDLTGRVSAPKPVYLDMPRLPASGAWVETPGRAEAELKIVLCDLGLARFLDKVAEHELYLKLGTIIGRWSAEQQRLEGSTVAKALLSTAQKLNEVSRLLAGIETGIRSDLEIAVASRVANLLSMDPTVGGQSGQDLLRSFRVEADRMAHVCLVAAADLPQGPGKRGRRAHKWYDAFTSLLLQIAEMAGITPALKKDRITKVRSGWLLDAAQALETFLDPFMRSPSSEACGKRLERSLSHLQKAKRQKSRIR
jgi:hypothetical protein